jgi:DNA polymerase-3 subunit epsilon
VDLETTGLDLRRDEVVAYGAVVVRSARVVVGSAVEGLVRPLTDPSPDAVRVHGLRPADLADAPGPDEAARRLADALAGRVLVAHAAWVEVAFLGRILGLAGARLDGPVVDTGALARAAGVVRPADHEPELADLAAALGLPAHARHEAIGDALTTATVLLALVPRLARGADLTVRDLSTLSRRHALR